MKLVNADRFLEIEIDENKPAQLVIENPAVMTEVVRELYEMIINGLDGNFILSAGNRCVSIEKEVEIIVNPLSIDFNSRAIQSKLYAEMLASDYKYTIEKAELQRRLINYIDALVANVPYEMITSNLEVDSTKLLKMCEVRMEPVCSSLLERLIEYVKILARLLNRKLLVLINICSWLNSVSLQPFFKMCEYVKLPILLIENIERFLPTDSKTYIIDRDQCLIIK